jgi:hypothetical protein
MLPLGRIGGYLKISIKKWALLAAGLQIFARREPQA